MPRRCAKSSSVANGVLVDERAARIVRRVDEDQLRALVREPHDLVDVEREAVLEAQLVAPRLDAERRRNLHERRERRRRHDDVRVRLAGDEEQREQRLGAAVEDEDLVGIRAVHRRERGAQRLAAVASGSTSSAAPSNASRSAVRHQRAKLGQRSTSAPCSSRDGAPTESRYFASHSSSTNGTSFMAFLEPGFARGVCARRAAADSGIIWPSGTEE